MLRSDLKDLAVIDTFFAIDFANVERTMAVEFNGPVNFLHDGSENGKTLAKRRLLKALGWKTKSIYWERWRDGVASESDPQRRLNVALADDKLGGGVKRKIEVVNGDVEEGLMLLKKKRSGGD